MFKKSSTAKLIVFAIIFIIIGMSINFVVHELSHMLMLIICQGSVEEISFGTNMFVGGYINYNYISVVALASIFIPFIISFILSLLKNTYVQFFNMGFSVPIVINILFGFIAHFFIKDVAIQNTYDLALACDFMEENIIILLLCGVILIIQIWLIIEGFKKIYKKI